MTRTRGTLINSVFFTMIMGMKLRNATLEKMRCKDWSPKVIFTNLWKKKNKTRAWNEVHTLVIYPWSNNNQISFKNCISIFWVFFQKKIVFLYVFIKIFKVCLHEKYSLWDFCISKHIYMKIFISCLHENFHAEIFMSLKGSMVLF